MLVCDHCHTKVCHIFCLSPAIEEIPFEPWYCDYCIRDHGIRSTLPTAGLFAGEPSHRRRLRRETGAQERRRQQAEAEAEESERHSSSSLINTHLSRQQGAIQAASQRGRGRRINARTGRGRRQAGDSQPESRSASPPHVNSNTFVFSANQLQARQEYRARPTASRRGVRTGNTLNSRTYQPRLRGAPGPDSTEDPQASGDPVTEFRRARSIFVGTNNRLSRENVDFPGRLRDSSFSEEFAAGPVGPRGVASGHW